MTSAHQKRLIVDPPNLMCLYIEMRFNGEPLATGTGFLVKSKAGPALLTNRHNFTGRHQETGQPLSKTGGVPNEILISYFRLNQEIGANQICQLSRPLLDADDEPLWREHPTLGGVADLAALPLTELSEHEIYQYDLYTHIHPISVGPSDSISVVGFPFGMTAGGLPIWATGFVATEPSFDFRQLPTFLIDCRTRPGQSGSAVIAHRRSGLVRMEDGVSAQFNAPVTRLLGIYSGRINSESDLGIVWKTSAILELVESI